jgi:arginyl-tRNA--protein-N-Asp/Glu arginylyltransferase
MNKWENYLSGKEEVEVEELKEKKRIQKIYETVSNDLKEIIDKLFNEKKSMKEFKVNVSGKKIKKVCDFSTSIAVQLSKTMEEYDSKTMGYMILKEFNENYLKNFQEIASTSVSDSGHLNFLLKEKKEKNSLQTKNIDMKIFPTDFKKEEFELYQKYQVKVHKDQLETLTEQQYTDFLCQTPLQYVKNPDWENSPLNLKYGSFHIQYLVMIEWFNNLVGREINCCECY